MIPESCKLLRCESCNQCAGRLRLLLLLKREEEARKLHAQIEQIRHSGAKLSGQFVDAASTLKGNCPDKVPLVVQSVETPLPETPARCKNGRDNREEPTVGESRQETERSNRRRLVR